MDVLGYGVRRLFGSLPVLLASTVLIFLAVALSGDPLDELRERRPPVPESAIADEERRLGLDRPLPERYLTWLSGVIRGDFGPSTDRATVIGDQLADRVGTTLRLVVLALLVAVVLAVVVGVVGAVRQYSWVDYLFTSTGFLFLAMPSFWLAVLLKQARIWVNQTTGTRVISTVGDRSPVPPEGWWPTVADLAGHLVLPTLTLVLVHFAGWSRFQRASMLEVLGSDHLRLATAKGVPRRTVLLTYGVRTALAPLVTVVALDFTAIVAGAVVTETVFQWRGMGDYLLSSITARDVNAVLAWLLVAAVAVVVFNLLADLLYAALDPRVRRVG